MSTEHTPYRDETLVLGLRQHRNWLDLRPRKTLAQRMVGLINAHAMSLCAGAPLVVRRAQQSQSTVRCWRRWLTNAKIAVYPLYGPLRQQALGEG